MRSREVALGEIAGPVTRIAKDRISLPVYSISKHDGFVRSDEYFKKQVHSTDTSSYKIVQPGDFAFSPIHLDEGSIALASQPGLISPMYKVFEVDRSRCDAEYLIRALKSPKFIRIYGNLGDGSVHRRRSVSFDRLLEVRLPLPSLAEQRRIAAILDKADALRRKRQRALELLDGLTQSIFMEMFPKNATLKPISALCDVSSGSTPRREDPAHFNGTVPWVKTGEVSGGLINETEEHVTEQGAKSARLRLYAPGTVLIAMYGQGATRGRVGILGVEATINQACAAIVPRFGLNSTFLFCQLKLNYQELRALGRGGNQPNLNGDLIKKFPIIAPPIEQQLKFTAVIDQIERRIQAMRSSLSTIETAFSSLQQRAFAGQL